jgi:hypothetical protein
LLINDLSDRAEPKASGDAFAASPAQSGGNRSQPMLRKFAALYFSGYAYSIASKQRHAFGDHGRCDCAFAKSVFSSLPATRLRPLGELRRV